MSTTNNLHEPEPGVRFVPEKFDHVPDATGYRLTHSMLYIRDPEKSLAFYRGYMGMSLVFALNNGVFTVYYLAYPSAGDAAPGDIAGTMATRSGLLELVYAHEAGGHASNTVKQALDRGEPRRQPGGFGHLGFVVPDVEYAVQRASAAGWQVVKDLGATSATLMPGLTPEAAKGSFDDGFSKIFSQIAFVQDPDGYWLELLPAKWN